MRAHYLHCIDAGLAAELNGFPGRLHTLDLAPELNLSSGQRAKIQELFGAMQKQAITLGQEIIVAERELDSLFKSRYITLSGLNSQTEKTALLQGRLRAVYLGKHLQMVQLLTADQVQIYNRLRGY